MSLVALHSKKEIQRFCSRNPSLHFYELGDLDDFFWPKTVWYGRVEDGEIQNLALLFLGASTPVLLSFTDGTIGGAQRLIQSIEPHLPRTFYAHLSPGAECGIGADYSRVRYGLFEKMYLAERSRLERIKPLGVPLSLKDAPEVQEFFQESYPNNCFDSRMLESGQYFGLREGGRIVCVAGVHVVSREYRSAALGNVATHPEFRARGLAKSVCARLCLSLLQTVDHIGLNVKADNSAAIACYEELGFQRVAPYEELEFSAALPRGRSRIPRSRSE